MKVTREEAERMWAMYQQVHSYKLVAQAMRRSPDTVAHHCKVIEAESRATVIVVEKK